MSIIEKIGNYTAKNSCEMVESKVLLLLERHHIWQYDNASIHTI